MDQISTQGILGGARKHFFVLFGLLFLSGAFFVSAADEMAGKNIVDDPDQDDLTTEEERLYGTDSMNRDTDGDGYTDGVEVRGGYDPLKKAPGDKIVSEKEKPASSSESFGVGGENVTEQVAQEIATLVQKTQEEGDGTSEVSLDELNAVVQDLSSGNTEEVALPEVEMDKIKIKKTSCKKLSEKKCKESVQENITEYLTVIAYIFANNSPKEFKTPDELKGISNDLVGNAMTMVSLGDMSQIDAFAENGEKMLAQIYDVEVPEEMLDVHVKAIKLARYAVTLKGKVSIDDADEDPMKMIESLSKVQGFLNVVSDFALEFKEKVSKYEIMEIPIDF